MQAQGPPTAGLLNSSTILDVLLLRPPQSPHKLVDVSATTLLPDALAEMRKHRVTALAVYGDKRHWVGAGELSLCTHEGKQYIGIVTILDVILHFSKRTLDPQHLLTSPIVQVIGSSPEGRTLWLGRSELPLLRTLEPLAKGVHRLLVPIWSPPADAETRKAWTTRAVVGASNGDPDHYALATQSDVLRWLHHHLQLMAHDPAAAADPLLRAIATATPRSLGFVPTQPFAVREGDPVLPTLTAMASLAVQAVPVVADDDDDNADAQTPPASLPRTRILTTLSASDFRRLVTDELFEPKPPSLPDIVRDLDGLTVGEFVRRVKGGFAMECVGAGLTCRVDETLPVIVARMVGGRVHRLWVVDGEGDAVVGVFSMTDAVRAVLELARG
ncbi:hypothetical protein HDU96_007606 [Phlyctochytrium bullatum]|nr:hypothetical protein HDU96_007606 [Phlyctochytrium bullatum]